MGGSLARRLGGEDAAAWNRAIAAAVAPCGARRRCAVTARGGQGFRLAGNPRKRPPNGRPSLERRRFKRPAPRRLASASTFVQASHNPPAATRYGEPKAQFLEHPCHSMNRWRTR